MALSQNFSPPGFKDNYEKSTSKIERYNFDNKLITRINFISDDSDYI